MLYDPKWEKTTKADPFTLESLVAWLESMPAKETYNWHDCHGGCLIGLYGAAMNLGIGWHKFHHQLYKQEQLHIAQSTPHTFGAALKRARGVLRSMPSPNHAK